MKTCSNCGANLPLTDFYQYNGKPQSWCKTCVKTKAKERINSKYKTDEAFREKQKQQAAEYYRNNTERRKAYHKQYREAKKKLDSDS